MDKIREEIDKIIVEAVNQNLEISKQDKNAGKCLHCPEATNQILFIIQEEMIKMLPDKKGRKICFGEDCTGDKNKGYNQAISDMHSKIMGIKKEE